ncbi:MAG: FAD-dependent oxidoreductase [Acidimicrobiia bacterium]|nr:FAD-dependent oxidoreductase [Acidimicrobiia bacterium]
MSDLPSSATVVVIGAGIVGNSVVHHLAELGWTDIVQIDKGPLPNPGGSTGHASNFIFPVDHNKEMTHLTRDSQQQYEEMGVNTACGGIEIARTEARMEELRRRMTSAKTYGIEARLVTPEEIKEMVPFINEEILLGGFYTPSVSVVDSLRAGTIMRERAMDKGALTVVPNIEVTGIEVEDGKVSGVQTDKGHITCDYIVIACGVWSNRIAAMAGATIPLIPAVHQMIDVGPLDVLQATNNEIGYPIVRDMDTFCYERQTGGSMEVGSYAHRPIFHHPDTIPSIEESRLSPTELPLTMDDFDPQLEQALELMPILGDAEIKYGINGLLSLTPDAMPLVGETVEVKNLWSCAAIWIKEGPGTGRALAEWMTHGYPEVDPHASDIARFYDYNRTEDHIVARCAEHFNKTYGIVHPREQWDSERNSRVSSLHPKTSALGAVYFEAGGWERPHWYESNARLLADYADEIPERPHEWDSRWWSPIQNAEHLAMRERVGMVDLTAFAIFDITGPGAVDYMQNMTVNQVDRPVGSAIYTPLLTPEGGFRSDLTVMRLGADHYRVVTGGFDGGRDRYWFRKWLPEDGSVTFTDVTSAYTTIGVWGPGARDLVAQVTTADVSHEGFPYGTVRYVVIGSIPALMFRISYVGDLGWEIYTAMEHGPRLWDTLWNAGQDLGVMPVGAGVYGTTGRLEKGYRLMGAELESDYNPVEAGLARPKVKSAEFIGKDAYMKAREEEPAAVCCTLTLESHVSASGVARFPMGGNEPILTLDGDRIVDAKGRVSRVTSAGAGPSVGKFLLLGYLPPEHAIEGTDLQIMYQNELFPVKVARASSQPLFDPEDRRMKS